MTDKPLIAMTGASGLLGRPLYRLLSDDPRYRVRGAALRRAGTMLDRVDLTAPAAVRNWLEDIRPAVLLHLAAERRPDVYADDPDSADRLNIVATEYLAGLCARAGIAMLYLSTSYVFDGTDPPYGPDDEPNPLNAYGRSKRAGEEAVIAASPLHRVLRIPMLFGPSGSLEESSVTVIARAFLEGADPVPLDVRQTRYPAWAPDIATAVTGLVPGLLKGDLPGPCLHFCPGPDGAYTKRDMGEIMAPLVGADPARAVADERPPSGAARPKDVGMACPGMEALGLLRLTPFPQAIAAAMDSIRKAGGLE